MLCTQERRPSLQHVTPVDKPVWDSELVGHFPSMVLRGPHFQVIED
jgi:hypothetical protein